MEEIFNLMICIAFRTLLLYENRREMTLDQFHKYRIKIYSNIKWLSK